MANAFNTAYPSVDDLRTKAKSRVPAFAFEYLDGGCNEDVSIKRNTSEIRDVQLQPRYLNNYGQSSTKTKVLGMEFDAPFGIAPVGLQGLMWPNSPAILAKAAHKHNVPFILSTVTT
ncbi:MAG: alpha-hydroxy-acid oxidizing protein, partial [Leeuwenhoekiella sp.]|nr:alpha-hydroxy-acid oxidizing protein [Leeuwenhoekiella sp.]